MRTPRGTVAVLAAAAIALTSAGCARKSNGTIDAPLGRQDNSRAQIVNMPDGWRNVATKCVPFQDGKRIYEARGATAFPQIVDDPNCKETP